MTEKIDPAIMQKLFLQGCSFPEELTSEEPCPKGLADVPDSQESCDSKTSSKHAFPFLAIFPQFKQPTYPTLSFLQEQQAPSLEEPTLEDPNSPALDTEKLREPSILFSNKKKPLDPFPPTPKYSFEKKIEKKPEGAVFPFLENSSESSENPATLDPLLKPTLIPSTKKIEVNPFLQQEGEESFSSFLSILDPKKKADDPALSKTLMQENESLFLQTSPPSLLKKKEDFPFLILKENLTEKKEKAPISSSFIETEYSQPPMSYLRKEETFAPLKKEESKQDTFFPSYGFSEEIPLQGEEVSSPFILSSSESKEFSFPEKQGSFLFPSMHLPSSQAVPNMPQPSVIVTALPINPPFVFRNKNKKKDLTEREESDAEEEKKEESN